MDDQPTPRPTDEASLSHIAQALGRAGFSLPGSVVSREMRCGKQGCRCKGDPPALHGPYYQWTRKVGGKTVTRWLTEDQATRYEAWFANARRLRELLTALEVLSLRVAERSEGWDPQEPPTGHRSRQGAPPPPTKPVAREGSRR